MIPALVQIASPVASHAYAYTSLRGTKQSGNCVHKLLEYIRRDCFAPLVRTINIPNVQESPNKVSTDVSLITTFQNL